VFVCVCVVRLSRAPPNRGAQKKKKVNIQAVKCLAAAGNRGERREATNAMRPRWQRSNVNESPDVGRPVDW
jgi:hypothetical protein